MSRPIPRKAGRTTPLYSATAFWHRVGTRTPGQKPTFRPQGMRTFGRRLHNRTLPDEPLRRLMLGCLRDDRLRWESFGQDGLAVIAIGPFHMAIANVNGTNNRLLLLRLLRCDARLCSEGFRLKSALGGQNRGLRRGFGHIYLKNGVRRRESSVFDRNSVLFPGVRRIDDLTSFAGECRRLDGEIRPLSQ